MRALLTLVLLALTAGGAAAQSGRIVKGESGDAATVDANGNLRIQIGASTSITYRYVALDDSVINSNIPSAQVGTTQGAANGVTPEESGMARMYVVGWCSGTANLSSNATRIHGWRLIQKIRIVNNNAAFVEAATGNNAISKSSDVDGSFSGQVHITDSGVGAIGTNGPLLDGIAMTTPENSAGGLADYQGPPLFCRNYAATLQTKLPTFVAQSGYMTLEYIAPSPPALWGDAQFFITFIAIPANQQQ